MRALKTPGYTAQLGPNETVHVRDPKGRMVDTCHTADAERVALEHSLPQLHSASREMLKQLAIAREVLKRNHPGNLYVERGEIESAICKAIGFDYMTVTIDDFDRAINTIIGGSK